MYKEHILDLYKHPHNLGVINNPTNKCDESNPLCGDQITVYVKVNNKKLEEVKFTGNGCAISIAAASIVTDKIKGMSVEQIKKLSEEEIIKMLNIPISHIRIKCAMICLNAVKGALEKD
jgi:nitrogen fixation NifU-like protein